MSRKIKREPYFFVSYSHRDREMVDRISSELRKRGLTIWRDVDNLRPGEEWASATEEALRTASGIIVFLSPNSLQSDSVQVEIAFAQTQKIAVFPIVLKPIEIPPALAHITALDLTQGVRKPAINKIVAALQSAAVQAVRLPAEPREVGDVARSIVEETRARHRHVAEVTTPPDSVFIVHGHDIEFLAAVEKYLRRVRITPIVLSKMSNTEMSLLQKFFTWSEDTRFAIVLVSADDLGAARREYAVPDVGDKALQFRARQNVILELGFFYGYLGWENVFVLYKPPITVFPHFERPSDMDGVVFDEVDGKGKWKITLRERLRKAGFNV